jgi:hypothetical protein
MIRCHNCTAPIRDVELRKEAGQHYHKHCPTLLPASAEIGEKQVLMIETQRKRLTDALKVTLLYLKDYDTWTCKDLSTWRRITHSDDPSTEALHDHITEVLS